MRVPIDMAFGASGTHQGDMPGAVTILFSSHGEAMFVSLAQTDKQIDQTIAAEAFAAVAAMPNK